MKKILSLVLAASMLATMAVTSFATDTEPTDNDGIMLLGGAVDNPNGNQTGGGTGKPSEPSQGGGGKPDEPVNPTPGGEAEFFNN